MAAEKVGIVGNTKRDCWIGEALYLVDQHDGSWVMTQFLVLLLRQLLLDATSG